jgi:anti-sigma B factor antagonist
MVSDGPFGLDIAIELWNDTPVIRLAGDLDIATSPRLIAAVRELVANGHGQIELDCSQIEFVDSAGVRALIVSRNETSRRGIRFDLMATSRAMSRVLDMTGLSALLVTSAAC